MSFNWCLIKNIFKKNYKKIFIKTPKYIYLNVFIKYFLISYKCVYK